MYAAIDSKTRKITKNYAVVGGTTRKITKMYGVVNGVTRLIWSGGDVTWDTVEYITNGVVFGYGANAAAGADSRLLDDVTGKTYTASCFKNISENGLVGNGGTNGQFIYKFNPNSTSYTCIMNSSTLQSNIKSLANYSSYSSMIFSERFFFSGNGDQVLLSFYSSSDEKCALLLYDINNYSMSLNKDYGFISVPDDQSVRTASITAANLDLSIIVLEGRSSNSVDWCSVMALENGVYVSKLNLYNYRDAYITKDNKYFIAHNVGSNRSEVYYINNNTFTKMNGAVDAHNRVYNPVNNRLFTSYSNQTSCYQLSQTECTYLGATYLTNLVPESVADCTESDSGITDVAYNHSTGIMYYGSGIYNGNTFSYDEAVGGIVELNLSWDNQGVITGGTVARSLYKQTSAVLTCYYARYLRKEY